MKTVYYILCCLMVIVFLVFVAYCFIQTAAVYGRLDGILEALP